MRETTWVFLNVKFLYQDPPLTETLINFKIYFEHQLCLLMENNITMWSNVFVSCLLQEPIGLKLKLNFIDNSTFLSTIISVKHKSKMDLIVQLGQNKTFGWL